ncbi:YxeA family protein [Paenibacillus sp. GCM10023248]|uniref:YxeA family protein n=1 Tax=Bacillales TaxID=1385 RepID=UPI0023788186|nr:MULTISPECIES: YxeA family protein [Bacillales]MDD9271909.1 YxeA family protein [Paenibacillus sp. MAHUQ-63]MDR6885232.1 uncharacterized protein (TIGR01655 family) [Bacillus sp. 3255]
MKNRRVPVMTLVVVMLAVVFIVLYKDVVDRFNPFLTKAYVYVQINQAPVPNHGRVEYKLTGYNAEGDKENVNFTASTELPKGTYLKVLAKGAYVQEWEKINPEEVPSAIKW